MFQVYLGMGYNYFSSSYYYFSNTVGTVSYTNWDLTSKQPHPENNRACVVIMSNRRMSSTVCDGSFLRRFLCQVP